MENLNQQLARNIIEQLGQSGQPPIWGHHFFSSGIDTYLDVIDEEYLNTFIKEGGAVFKILKGQYGGGKTHFLYSVRNLAWDKNYIVSYVSLKKGESPFSKLELVYKAIINNLIPPLKPEKLLDTTYKGIKPLIDLWIEKIDSSPTGQNISSEERVNFINTELDTLNHFESLSFGRAIKNAFKYRYFDDDENFETICQWLNGEGYDRKIHGRQGIYERIDKTTAFKMIRSLVNLVNQIGFNGMVILFDEAEQIPSLSSKEKGQHLNNLRELIDVTAQAGFTNVMLFYAVPDMEFLETTGTGVYEALRQRTSTVFSEINPTGVRIELDDVIPEPIPFLEDVGSKISKIFEMAYDINLEPEKTKSIVSKVAHKAYEQRYADTGYRRIFVMKLVEDLYYLKQKGDIPTYED
ncbi:MAG: hypothetical protein GF364_00585 [Candidatus Lokiarchaeota archaeon]|nr:hypothetical protein [Candidatus Lokiarchaeota archaeon]